jgi:hypothetical protein
VSGRQRAVNGDPFKISGGIAKIALFCDYCKLAKDQLRRAFRCPPTAAENGGTTFERRGSIWGNSFIEAITYVATEYLVGMAVNCRRKNSRTAVAYASLRDLRTDFPTYGNCNARPEDVIDEPLDAFQTVKKSGRRGAMRIDRPERPRADAHPQPRRAAT